MELEISQQIFEQIKKSSRVLVVLPERTSVDALASGLALKLFLEKLKKDVELASAAPLPNQAQFLPGIAQVKAELPGGKSLVINVSTLQKKLQEISYETTPDKVSIFIKGETTGFEPSDITFSRERAPYDLVFTLGAPGLAALGKIFENNPEIFYETPKINIDHKPDNEFFGAINLVDLTATSVGEILANLFQQFEEQLMDENIATCLLASIMAKTDSFQHVKTTPRAFLTASQLVELGGRQQDIVQAFYKTKPLNFLRLWGRLLAKLKSESPQGLYAVLGTQDFEKAGSGAENLPQALEELLVNISDKKILAVVVQLPDGGSQILAAVHDLVPLERLSPLGTAQKTTSLSPHNFRLLEFFLPQTPPAQAEQLLVQVLESI